MSIINQQSGLKSKRNVHVKYKQEDKNIKTCKYKHLLTAPQMAHEALQNLHPPPPPLHCLLSPSIPPPASWLLSLQTSLPRCLLSHSASLKPQTHSQPFSSLIPDSLLSPPCPRPEIFTCLLSASPEMEKLHKAELSVLLPAASPAFGEREHQQVPAHFISTRGPQEPQASASLCHHPLRPQSVSSGPHHPHLRPLHISKLSS